MGKKSRCRIGGALSLIFVLSGALGACGEKEPVTFSRPEVTLEEHSAEEIRDKVLGCWVGQTIGLGSGLEYIREPDNQNNGIVVEGRKFDNEVAYFALADKYWEPNGEICAGTYGSNKGGINNLAPYHDRRIGKGYCISDDDMHVDILNQFIFRDNGANIGAEDIKDAWVKYDVADLGGGVDAMRLMSMNYVAPYTGQSTYGNAAYFVTESWIENETIGTMFPYMTAQAEAYIDMFTSVQGDSYATYLGKLAAIMHSLAYQYDDMKEILRIAFSRMGHSNGIYEMYEYVLGEYESGEEDWRNVCEGVAARAVSVAAEDITDKLGFSINANAGMIFLAMIYGENDFEQTLKIASLAGLDGDCTAATVGGIIGTAYGYDSLPEKYKDFLDGDSIYYNYTGSNGKDFQQYSPAGITWSGAFSYMGANFPNELTYDQLTDITVSNIENQIIARGGSVEGEVYRIPVLPYEPIPSVEVTNYGFESGGMDGWTLDAPEGTVFTARSAAAHLGEYGGQITLPEISASAKVYQSLSLQEGHVYSVEIWVRDFTDREFRLFAGEENDMQYRAYINPIAASQSRFMKAELIFTATSDTMDVGVYIPAAAENAFSMTFSFDDLYIRDITESVSDDTAQVFETEKCAALDGTIVRDKKASDGKALEVYSGGGFRFEAEGNPYGYQNFDIYYKNTYDSSATCMVYVDEELQCVLPLVAAGRNGEFNSGNFARLWLNIGEGTHTVKIVLTSYNEVQFDKVKISVGSALL